MKQQFKLKRAIVVFCTVMALNLALVLANHASVERIPNFIYVLLAIIDWPSVLLFLGFALLFDVSSFQGRHDFSFLTYYVNGIFSALVWAIFVGFIFRRKSIAEKHTDITK
jgi:hypothetical protein